MEVFSSPIFFYGLFVLFMATQPTERFSINKFRTAIGAPARSFLFTCQITPSAFLQTKSSEVFPNKQPNGIFNDTDGMLPCLSVTIPEIIIESVNLSYFSRAVKIPGKRTFNDLTLKFLNTEDFNLRTGFENWNYLLGEPETNRTITPSTTRSDLTATIKVEQYSLTHELIKTYTFYEAFPVTVGPFTLSYDGDGENQTFDVTMAYNYFK